MLFCGIDTSNYTTSAALCDEGGNINIKYTLDVDMNVSSMNEISISVKETV
jgi:hypothetical protein